MLRFRSDTRGDKKSLHKNSLIYRGLKQLILKANGYKDDFIEFEYFNFKKETNMNKTEKTFSLKGCELDLDLFAVKKPIALTL